mmetsp:Transcript_16464/g.38082  ORF Transcript_16464/g.38082 Transcript_16464/m.38082 type:complete len:400 (+) Transcript_16464:253-1452(+)
MNSSILSKPEKVVSSRHRRQINVVFSLVVILKALHTSHCFVPRLFGTTAYLPRADTFRIQQQLTHIDSIKSNEGAQAGIGNAVATSNNTEYIGSLQQRKNEGEDASGIFPVAPLKLSKEVIESTVDDAIKTSMRSMGLFGTMVEENSATKGVSILASSSKSSPKVDARVATVMDDLQIANLRLSVFSNFNPESRKLFCERSCQLLSSRRRRGATCVVATTKKEYFDDTKRKSKTRDIYRNGDEAIVGTAEVSFHEFSGTQLGSNRPKGAILYVTEVAVDVIQRRKGIAKLMMEAIDILAKSRKIETIYLHVDVTNTGAVNLYEAAGYRKLKYDNPIFLEFTTKLNLHNGATKGRNHYMMAKDLRTPTWFTVGEESRHHEESCILNSQESILGFDVVSTI